MGEPLDHTGSTSQGDIVQMTLPLRAEYGSTLRVVVASLGADAGFTIDEIDDLRLGVSEVFTILADGGVDGRCVARFELAPGEVCVTLGSGGSTTGAPRLDDLAATILSSVVDEYEERPDGLRLVKRATESTNDA